jgi:hypothetical protein
MMKNKAIIKWLVIPIFEKCVYSYSKGAMNSWTTTTWSVHKASNIYFIVLVSNRCKFIYAILGEDFDYQVRLEFIEWKEKLGEGGFGSVYLAFDKLVQENVAIKVLNFSSNAK